MSLHICLISQRFPTAGFLWAVAQGLTQAGHRVTVLTQKRASMALAWSIEGATVHGLGDARSVGYEFARLALEKFEEIHSQTPFDLVHSIDSSGLLIGMNRKRFNVSVIYDVNATHLGKLFSILGSAQETLGSLLKTSFSVTWNFLKTYYGKDRQLLRTADAIFVHSPQQRIALERYYLYPDSRTFTVPFGLRVEDLSPRQKSVELMKKLGLPNNSQTVVTITDMTDFSEMRSLLRAFEKVAIKKHSARLIIIGTGPLRKEIEFEMLSLALGGRTHFVGELSSSSLSEHIALADVFVNLSARNSDVDQSLLEAMAQRKVIIGSEVSPLGTVVDDGVDGFLIRPADIATLAELIQQTFNHQIKVLEIGDRARKKVLNLFDAKKMMDLTLQAYSRSLKRSGYFRSTTGPSSDSVTPRSL
jgi:glycosyltransferase involved in cell wall biosynthesis